MFSPTRLGGVRGVGGQGVLAFSVTLKKVPPVSMDCIALRGGGFDY